MERTSKTKINFFPKNMEILKLQAIVLSLDNATSYVKRKYKNTHFSAFQIDGYYNRNGIVYLFNTIHSGMSKNKDLRVKICFTASQI